MKAAGVSWAGVGYALGAFGLWGLFPLYFKAVAAIPPPEVLAHRILWSVVFVALLLFALRQWPAVRVALGDRRMAGRLLLSAVLIAINWLTFIWAVAHEQVLEASLGYFITPLVSVLLGRLVLGEALARLQWLAVALAALGVGYMLAGLGKLPWVSLVLAVTFGSYGLARKTTPVAAAPGLFVETLLLAPLAIGFLLWLGEAGTFGRVSPRWDVLLAAAGLVTALPLILFVQAARRLRLASVGLFQYLTPTCQMLLAVFAFGEPFTRGHAVTFGCIWLGLALYSFSSWKRQYRAPVLRDV